MRYALYPRTLLDRYISIWYNDEMFNEAARWFGKYFIPHEGNDHRPHILRRKIIAFTFLIAIVGELLFILGTSLAPRSNLFGIILVSALTDETNNQRIVNDLPALRMNPLLQVAAQEKANDMAANGYFAHTSPTGKTPWYWFANVGYNFRYAGENLAINFADSQDVTDAWMNSPKHRDNILNTRFSDIGIATAQGEFNGKPAIYVVELFGTPAGAAVTAKATPPPAAVPAPIVIASGTATSVNASQTFIAVKGAVTETVPLAAEANSAQTAAANPRQTANYFFLIIAGIFIVALAFNVLIKIRIQHPDLILGGVLVIAIVSIFIMLNRQLISGITL